VHPRSGPACRGALLAARKPIDGFIPLRPRRALLGDERRTPLLPSTSGSRLTTTTSRALVSRWKKEIRDDRSGPNDETSEGCAQRR